MLNLIWNKLAPRESAMGKRNTRNIMGMASIGKTGPNQKRKIFSRSKREEADLHVRMQVRLSLAHEFHELLHAPFVQVCRLLDVVTLLIDTGSARKHTT